MIQIALVGLLWGCGSPASDTSSNERPDIKKNTSSTSPAPTVASPEKNAAPSPTKPGDEAIGSLHQKSSKLQFLSEKIQVNVLPGGKEVVIGGRYVFENPKSQKWFSRIYFPFFIDNDHPRPQQVKVTPGSFSRHKNGIAVQMKIGPKKQKELTIAYRQLAPKQHAVHVVSSAMAFEKNLQSARFDFILPSEFRLEKCSYPLTLWKKEDGRRLYRCEKNDFTPDTDFTVSWSAR